MEPEREVTLAFEGWMPCGVVIQIGDEVRPVEMQIRGQKALAFLIRSEIPMARKALAMGWKKHVVLMQNQLPMGWKEHAVLNQIVEKACVVLKCAVLNGEKNYAALVRNNVPNLIVEKVCVVLKHVVLMSSVETNLVVVAWKCMFVKVGWIMKRIAFGYLKGTGPT